MAESCSGLIHVEFAGPALVTIEAGVDPALPSRRSPSRRAWPGRGCWAYIVTSKFSEYVPLYRLEDIFAAGLRDLAGHAAGLVR